VPLFFWLSGVVISSAPTPHKFLLKARRFLVPMLVVGFINALLIGKVRSFFLDGGHNGYWYLLTLTIFYFFLLPFRLSERMKGIRGFLIDSLLSIGIWILFVLLQPFSGVVLYALNPWAAFAFWPFFIIGYLCRKYSLTNYITSKPWMTTTLILAYLILVIISFPSIDHLPIVLDFTIAIVAIGAVVALFYHFSNSRTFIDRQLLLIGNSTLNIYVYHYFFIRFINLEFLKSQSLITEIIVTVSLTIIITYCSMAIGIGINRILSLYKRYKSIPHIEQ
jgi:fucose 4-O-acetylase-like acetyltransferase